MNPGVANTINSRAFTVSSFFSYYMFHPAEASTKRERNVSFWTSAALFILSLGLVHLVCRICLYDRKIAVVSNPNQLDKKTTQTFQDKHGVPQVPNNSTEKMRVLEGAPKVVVGDNKVKIETEKLNVRKKPLPIPVNKKEVSTATSKPLPIPVNKKDVSTVTSKPLPIPVNKTGISTDMPKPLSSRIKHFEENGQALSESEKKHKHSIIHKFKHWHPFRKKHKLNKNTAAAQI